MSSIADLATLVARHFHRTGMASTPIPRLSLFRADQPTVPLPALYDASVCLIVQGAKRVSLGGQSFDYDAAQYLLVSVDLPLVGLVTQATGDTPYLCCKIDIDQTALANLIMAEGNRAPKSELPVLAVCRSGDDLIDALRRAATFSGRSLRTAMSYIVRSGRSRPRAKELMEQDFRRDLLHAR